jgi:pantetheine-phosphate adenylyltransferase
VAEKPKIVIYPGTFDPITNGHLDIITRASELFDEVIVAIATNTAKVPLLSEKERIELCWEAVREHKLPSEVSVDSFDGLLVDYAHKVGAVAVIRGLRALSDFEYEFQMALMNRKIENISTVFLMPNEKYTYLNSTIIRELARHKRDVIDFVPACVQRELEKKFS